MATKKKGGLGKGFDSLFLDNAADALSDSGAVTLKISEIEPDRSKAIKLSINMAKEGDTVLIAGKGHEDYQIFADKTIHFDDCEHARNAVIEREGK